MDFSRVLEKLAQFLDEAESPHAVIGGVAMAAYGLPRTTLDLDLVVDGNVQDVLISHLEAAGYCTLHRSTGYSNHLHQEPQWGRVDVVYVRGETRRKLFAATRTFPGPGGLSVRVPCPEHLAAMKVLAMKNDPRRTFRELEDIRHLLTLADVDREEIRQQFQRHGLEKRYAELQEIL